MKVQGKSTESTELCTICQHVKWTTYNSKVIEYLEQNVWKLVYCKRALNTKQMNMKYSKYEIFELKNGNIKLSNVLKYN